MMLRYTSLGRRFRITRAEKTSVPKMESRREAKSSVAAFGAGTGSPVLGAGHGRGVENQGPNVKVHTKICNFCNNPCAELRPDREDGQGGQGGWGGRRGNLPVLPALPALS